MHYGVVKGQVVATRKVEDLKGMALKVITPTDSAGEPIGAPIVAVDGVGARVGDLVLWVAKREASLAIPGAPLKNNYPVDAAVTAIVDEVG